MKPIEEGALYGAFVIRHREVLRERLGSALVRAAIADLEPDAQKAIEAASPVLWVPAEAIEGFFDAVARRAERDAGSLHEEVGAITIERTIFTIWRVLLQLTTDAHLVSQVPVLYRKTWNRGMLSADIDRPGHATMRLTGWPGVPEFPARGVRIAVQQALTLSGRKGVRVDQQRSADGVLYSVAWNR